MGTLYENLKELCEERNIAPSNFGTDISGSKAFMTELKMGRKKGVSAKTAQKIADYFGVSVDRVLYGKREEEEKTVESGGVEKYLERLRSSSATRALLDATDDIDENQVRIIAEFIKKTRGGE